MATKFRSLAVFSLLLLANSSCTTAPTSTGLTQVRTTKSGVTLIGEVGLQLSEQDVRDLQRVLPGRQIPWLLIGERGQTGNSQQLIQAFLPPTSTRPDLRRGPLISVSRWTDPTPQEWTIPSYAPAGTQSYAQVAIEGRNFDQVLNAQDMNRPFRVVGTVDDADLVSIVGLLRSIADTASPQSVQPWPTIMVEARADNEVVVTLLRVSSMSGQRVTLQKQGQTWIVVSVRIWVA
jgi:hypothetical protein